MWLRSGSSGAFTRADAAGEPTLLGSGQLLAAAPVVAVVALAVDESLFVLAVIVTIAALAIHAAERYRDR